MRDFQILSLSGGGYGGLYTAAVLAEFERKCGQPIGRCFEVIAGTSIGGIIALAIGFEVPMDEIVNLFKSEGLNIFPRRGNKWLQKKFNLFVDFNKPFYSLEKLRSLIEKILDKDAKLGDSKHPLLIPAINLTQGKPQVFKTRHYEDIERDPLLNAIDIALATAAAPTFFPPARINDCLYVDGGLVATSPDLIALHEASHFLKQAPENILMLSIGTTNTKYSIADDPRNSYGLEFWLADEENRLPKTFLSAQQQFTLQITKHILGEGYIRVDTAPSPEQVKFLGLTEASPIAQTTLLGLGKKDATDALGNPIVREALKHTAKNLLMKG